MTTLDLTPDELLTTTRTVRKRLDLQRPVPLELITECIEIALQAPSGSNRQDWHWLVITDEEKRRFIGEVYRTAVREYLGSAGSVTNQFTDDALRAPVQQRIGGSVAWLGEHMGEVPVLVIPCIRAPELPAGNQAGKWGSLLPAAWSYALAARARGLGTAWTTLHLEQEAAVAEALGLPPEIRQGVLLPTAYFTGETFRPAPRQPVAEVLHVNGW
ncbi:nitroreductase [Nakamurella silvestris]|nr:nitroreductase [Nakamurella silvestris]